MHKATWGWLVANVCYQYLPDAIFETAVAPKEFSFRCDHEFRLVADRESWMCRRCAKRVWIAKAAQPASLWQRIKAWWASLFADEPQQIPAPRFDWSEHIRKADEQDRKDFADNPLAFWATPDRWEGIDKPNRRDPGSEVFWMIDRVPVEAVQQVQTNSMLANMHRAGLLNSGAQARQQAAFQNQMAQYQGLQSYQGLANSSAIGGIANALFQNRMRG